MTTTTATLLKKKTSLSKKNEEIIAASTSDAVVASGHKTRGAAAQEFKEDVPQIRGVKAGVDAGKSTLRTLLKTQAADARAPAKANPPKENNSTKAKPQKATVDDEETQLDRIEMRLVRIEAMLDLWTRPQDVYLE